MVLSCSLYDPMTGKVVHINIHIFKEQWESYLGNIVQIVYDEKDARSYLETLANKMGEELENLRMAKNSQLPLQKHIQTVSQSANQSAGNPLMSIDNGQGNDSEKWRTLRKNKVKNQQILELQSTLQEEIQLRHQINTDLTMERQNNQDRIFRNQKIRSRFVSIEPGSNLISE